MEKIRSFEELEAKQAVCTKCMDDKFSGNDGKRHVVLCGGTGCLSSHSDKIRERFCEVIKERGLDDKVTVNQLLRAFSKAGYEARKLKEGEKQKKN